MRFWKNSKVPKDWWDAMLTSMLKEDDLACSFSDNQTKIALFSYGRRGGFKCVAGEVIGVGLRMN